MDEAGEVRSLLAKRLGLLEADLKKYSAAVQTLVRRLVADKGRGRPVWGVRYGSGSKKLQGQGSGSRPEVVDAGVYLARRVGMAK